MRAMAAMTATEMRELEQYLKDQLTDVMVKKHHEYVSDEVQEAVKKAVDDALANEPLSGAVKFRALKFAGVVAGLLIGFGTGIGGVVISGIASDAATRAATTTAQAVAAEEARLVSVSAVADQLRASDDFRDVVVGGLQNGFQGAVVAFDIENGCPAGWSAFEEAGGRFIIGAVSEDDLGDIPGDFRRDARNADLNARPFGEPGGEQMVVLSEGQMPRHSHSSGTLEARPSGDLFHVNETLGTLLGPSGNLGVVLLGSSTYAANTGAHGHAIAGEVGDAGRSEPHPNMPPYIALYYCKKT